MSGYEHSPSGSRPVYGNESLAAALITHLNLMCTIISAPYPSLLGTDKANRSSSVRGVDTSSVYAGVRCVFGSGSGAEAVMTSRFIKCSPERNVESMRLHPLRQGNTKRTHSCRSRCYD